MGQLYIRKQYKHILLIYLCCNLFQFTSQKQIVIPDVDIVVEAKSLNVIQQHIMEIDVPADVQIVQVCKLWNSLKIKGIKCTKKILYAYISWKENESEALL